MIICQTIREVATRDDLLNLSNGDETPILPPRANLNDASEMLSPGSTPSSRVGPKSANNGQDVPSFTYSGETLPARSHADAIIVNNLHRDLPVPSVNDYFRLEAAVSRITLDMKAELDHTRRAQEDLREVLQVQFQESAREAQKKHEQLSTTVRTQNDQVLALLKSLVPPPIT